MHIVSKGVQIVNEHGKLTVRSAMDIACDDRNEANLCLPEMSSVTVQSLKLRPA